MFSVSIEVRGLEQVERMLRSLGRGQTAAWSQQALNREGNLEKGRSAREIQKALPVKLKYLRSRIVWRNAQRDGTPGRLRFYGSGKGTSAWIRPRHMKPAYPTSDTRVSLGSGRNNKVRRNSNAQRRRAAAVQYGVGGAMPEAARRSVLRGFVSSVHAGPSFVHSYQPGFDRNKSQFFQRVKGARMPIRNNRGVTIGTVARRTGMLDRVAKRIGERAALALQQRIERELKARASKG